jgi:hypothetical protein
MNSLFMRLEAATAQAHFGILEDGRAAHGFQADDVAHEARIGRFELLAVGGAAQVSR